MRDEIDGIERNFLRLNSLAVANYFIEKSHSDKNHSPLTPLKLQKMIYFANGIFLANKGKPMIASRIVAWRFGPVIEEVYHQFKGFGNDAVNQFASFFDEKYSIYDKNSFDEREMKEIVNILDDVWDVCKDITASQLSNWSHEKGSPWDKTEINEPISDNVMAEYFKKYI